MQHTKGSWIVEANSLSGKDKGFYIKIKDSDWSWVADVKCANLLKGTIKEAKSNAKLIAAAPEMLEALKTSLEILQFQLGKDYYKIYDVTKMKQAIKKAT